MAKLHRIFYYLRVIKVITCRQSCRYKRSFRKYWNTHSGNWVWLRDRPMSIAGINRHLWRLSVPSSSFYLLLGLSGIISTLGLLANSVAVIIGAMIIAPLMGPIVSIAYAMTMGNRRLLRRSSLTLATGVILTILLSYFACIISGLKSDNLEILARANPTLIDLGVALTAGAAGAFANSRRRIADALPGVAISVALVPPLSVFGIGLAWRNQDLYVGSLLLFVTNLISIIFSGGLVFIFQNYGDIRRAKQGLLVSVITLAVLGVPLGLQMRNLIIKQNVRQSIERLIRLQTLDFTHTNIESLEINIDPQKNLVYIELQITSKLSTISPNKVDIMRKSISEKIGQPVILEVMIIPVSVIKSEPDSIN